MPKCIKITNIGNSPSLPPVSATLTVSWVARSSAGNGLGIDQSGCFLSASCTNGWRFAMFSSEQDSKQLTNWDVHQ